MELIKEDIQVLRTKSKAASQVTFDLDYNVPDAKPDIGRMIQNKGEVTVEELRLSDGPCLCQRKSESRSSLCRRCRWQDLQSYSGSSHGRNPESCGIVKGDKIQLNGKIEDLSIL